MWAIMKINGRRTHLGERPRVGGVVRARSSPLAPRPSPDPDLVVVWYCHRDAPSVLPPSVVSPPDRTQSRGAILFRLPAWSWLG